VNLLGTSSDVMSIMTSKDLITLLIYLIMREVLKIRKFTSYCDQRSKLVSREINK